MLNGQKVGLLFSKSNNKSKRFDRFKLLDSLYVYTNGDGDLGLKKKNGFLNRSDTRKLMNFIEKAFMRMSINILTTRRSMYKMQI